MPDTPQMPSKFVEIVPLSHHQGTVSPLQPSGRILLAVDSLGLYWSGSSSQFIDPPQEFLKQVPGHGDFGQLCQSEGNVPPMTNNFGPILTRFSRSVVNDQCQSYSG